MSRRSRRTRGDDEPRAVSAPPGGDDFADELAALGFAPAGETRRGGRLAVLEFNRHLRFMLHQYDDATVLTWSFSLGEFAEERGWQLGVTDVSAAELYPAADVRLPRDVEAIGAEITRVLATLRLDLGDPQL